MSGFDIAEIDEIIHGRIRLGVLSFLASAGGANFGELRDVLKTTDGNLSEHLKKLEEGGVIRIEKTFVGRRPQTRVFMTPEGTQRFIAYLEALSKLVAMRPSI